MTGPVAGADRTSGSRREVNLRAYAYAVRVGRSLPEEQWEFLCECGDGSCEERVRLRLDEYTGLRADEEPILASGHVGKTSASSSVGEQELVSR